MKRFLQAKGRLKIGEMNRTEAAYRDYLEQQKNAGLILKYWFERFTWKIASNRCSYTPDFPWDDAKRVIADRISSI